MRCPPSRGHALLRTPNLARIFRDAPVTGEFSRCRDVQYGFARPGLLVLVQFTQPRMSFAVAFKIGQVQVIIAVAKQRTQDWPKYARFIPAEMVGSDQVERRPGFWFVFVMPP